MRKLLLAALVLLAAFDSSRALSQEWPQRPVRMIVPFAAGGNGDVMARVIAQYLRDAFGQNFVVENRPGAAGALGAEIAARSPADGYTLFVGSLATIAIVPAMTKAPYDPVTNFAPICVIGTNPLVLAAHRGMRVRNLQEFVVYARDRPGKLTYAAAGSGSLTHLSMALFLHRTGLDMVPVMYKGGGAPITDVVAGHVNTTFVNLSVAVPYAKSDELKLLAVSSNKRAAQLPDVPTFMESDIASFNIQSWTGLLAPAGTPKGIIDRLANEISRAVRAPQTAAVFARNGVDPVGNSPDDFAATIAADIRLWAETVKIAGVQEK